MRVVFMGTPQFAVPSLQMLVRDHDVAAVYSRPDAQSGRGRVLAPSPVSRAALEAGIPLERPRTLRDPEIVAALRAYDPDVIVVAAYGLILPADILSVPRFRCLNVHASLLPRWRGAAPIQRAILAGDREVGVSIMRMEEGLDTGPFAVTRTTQVGEKNAAALTEELATLGAEALEECLYELRVGEVVWQEQDASLATYAEKVTAADVALGPELDVATTLRRVRSSGPTAPARLIIGDRRLVVIDAAEASSGPAAGSVSTESGLVIGVRDGAVALLTVVPEGRAAMDGASFARGARLQEPILWSPA